MTGGKVLSLFAPPSRQDSLRAISLALLRIRGRGVTCEELGRQIECCADTVENASNERALLSFDAIARLAFHYPDEFKLVAALWAGGGDDAPSTSERVARAMEELKIIAREIAA